VIVESPAKAKTIEKYLGKNYKVVASVGHFRDLPKSRMGVTPDEDYKIDYLNVRGKGDLIKGLKKEAKGADKIYLASDPDREGESIAWHLAFILGLDTAEKNRVVFNEITKDAVKDAFKNPRAIDMDLVNAQQARRVLDRLIGYSISPILWKKIKGKLSAGRVQSSTVKMIIEREREIRAFTPEEYWVIPGLFKKDRSKFSANYAEKLKNGEETDAVIAAIKGDEFVVENVDKKERRRKATPAFTTSTLQQSASSKLRFRTGKTMSVAQLLYQGIALGKKGTVGLITYMRTDSTRISDLAKNEALEFITETYGAEFASGVPKKGTAKGAQDAHEAIRPTSIHNTPASVERYLDKDQLKLYTLIYNRFLASLMADAVYDTTRVELVNNGVKFVANGQTVKFKGFTAVYDETKDDDKKLPVLEVGDKVTALEITPEQKFTQPPGRYTESSLVKALEENGIGRPSTYAPTIQNIQKFYIKLDQKKFVPTELGEIVNELLENHFTNVVNLDFTARMEEELDEIATGEMEWKKVVDSFYRPFEQELIDAEEKIEKIQIKDEPVGEDCPDCGHPLVYRLSKNGRFIGCSNFPACRYVRNIENKIGVKCPKCHEGDVVEKRGAKRGRLFFGCNRYPECDFVSWDKPVGRDCPECNHFLVEKVTRKDSQVICPNGDYEENKIQA
jgi:DNA topoisomerase-1